jgi:peroxiredoxin
MKREYLLAPLAAVTLLMATGAALSADDLYSEMGIVTPKTRVDAPDFALENLQGEEHRLAEFKGKVIMLNFWATWCEPCRKEMPSMQTLWEAYKDKGFVIVAVAGDRGIPFFSSMTKGTIESFVKELGLTYPILWDSKGKVRPLYEVWSLPWTYLIGKDGKIIGKAPGERDWASPKARALVEQLLEEGT